MDLRDKILADLQEAMRAKDTQRRSTLRLVRTTVTNEEIKVGHALNDEGVLEILQREAKRRREAMDEYTKAGRTSGRARADRVGDS